MLKRRVFKELAAALLVASMPASAAAQQGAEAPQTEQSELARFRAAVEEMRRTMLRRGPRVANWDRGGADVDAELRSLGTDRFYLLSPSSSGPQIGILTGRPISDFAPAAWRVVDSYGQAGEGLDNPGVEFAMLTPRFIIGARAASVRRNDVDCLPGVSHALLFEVPDAPASADDDVAQLLFRMTILAAEGIEICTRTEATGKAAMSCAISFRTERAFPSWRKPAAGRPSCPQRRSTS
jgi:hypothetical protein